MKEIYDQSTGQWDTVFKISSSKSSAKQGWAGGKALHICSHPVLQEAQWGAYYFYSHPAERLNNVPHHTTYKGLSSKSPGSLTAEATLVITKKICVNRIICQHNPYSESKIREFASDSTLWFGFLWAERFLWWCKTYLRNCFLTHSMRKK